MTNETKLFILFETLLLLVVIKLSIHFTERKKIFFIERKEIEFVDTKLTTSSEKFIVEQKKETKKLFNKIEIEESCIEEWRGE